MESKYDDWLVIGEAEDVKLVADKNHVEAKAVVYNADTKVTSPEMPVEIWIKWGTWEPIADPVTVKKFFA